MICLAGGESTDRGVDPVEPPGDFNSLWSLDAPLNIQVDTHGVCVTLGHVDILSNSLTSVSAGVADERVSFLLHSDWCGDIHNKRTV